jgi:hypothetical protein
MPNWTLGELMSMATARCGRRDDISASTVSFWVNEAYMEVAQMAPHALLESTTKYSITSGTSRLDLPGDHLETLSLSWDTVDVGSARTLLPTNSAWCDSVGYYPVAMPQRFFEYGSVIQLWPSADSYDSESGRSFLLRYRARPSDMTATSAVPSVATEWRKAILYKAEAFLHEYVGNDIEAAHAHARFAAYTSSLQDSHARRQHSGRMAASLPLRQSRY